MDHAFIRLAATIAWVGLLEAASITPSRAITPSSADGRAIPASARNPTAIPAKRTNRAISAPEFVSNNLLPRWGSARILYVDDFQQNCVFVYAVRDAPVLVGTIQGLSGPEQMALDRNGDLFIANGFASQVLIFRPGTTVPLETLTDKLLYPSGVALDSKGTLYVANNSDYSTVVSFQAGQRTATVLTSSIPHPVSAVVDRYDNLFIGAEARGVYEKPAGSSTFFQLPIAGLVGQFVSGVGIDGDGDLESTSEPNAYAYIALPVVTSYLPFETTPHDQFGSGDYFGYNLSSSSNSIIVSYAFNVRQPGLPGFVSAYHIGATTP